MQSSNHIIGQGGSKNSKGISIVIHATDLGKPAVENSQGGEGVIRFIEKLQNAMSKGQQQQQVTWSLFDSFKQAHLTTYSYLSRDQYPQINIFKTFKEQITPDDEEETKVGFITGE